MIIEVVVADVRYAGHVEGNAGHPRLVKAWLDTSITAWVQPFRTMRANWRANWSGGGVVRLDSWKSSPSKQPSVPNTRPDNRPGTGCWQSITSGRLAVGPRDADDLEVPTRIAGQGLAIRLYALAHWERRPGAPAASTGCWGGWPSNPRNGLIHELWPSWTVPGMATNRSPRSTCWERQVHERTHIFERPPSWMFGQHFLQTDGSSGIGARLHGPGPPCLGRSKGCSLGGSGTYSAWQTSLFTGLARNHHG